MKVKLKQKPQRYTMPFWELQRIWYLNGQVGELKEASPELLKSEQIHRHTPIGFSGDGWAAVTEDGSGMLVFNDEWVKEHTGSDDIEACKEWRLVFAWKPCRVGESEGRWLEFVWRRQLTAKGGFEYMSIN